MNKPSCPVSYSEAVAWLEFPPEESAVLSGKQSRRLYIPSRKIVIEQIQNPLTVKLAEGGVSHFMTFEYKKDIFAVRHYSEGTIMLSYLESCEAEEDVSALTHSIFLTIAAILDFHERASGHLGRGVIHGEPHWRNAIIRADTACLIDFDSVRPGEPEEDIGAFLAYFLLYRPELSTFKTNCLSKVFDREPRIKRAVGKEARQILDRRGRKIPGYKSEALICSMEGIGL